MVLLLVLTHGHDFLDDRFEFVALPVINEFDFAHHELVLASGVVAGALFVVDKGLVLVVAEVADEGCAFTHASW